MTRNFQAEFSSLMPETKLEGHLGYLKKKKWGEGIRNVPEQSLLCSPAPPPH